MCEKLQNRGEGLSVGGGCAFYVLYVFVVKPHEKSSSPERNPIGRRTESDWTANGIRLDGERNLIGRRTQSDWTANAGETVLVSDVAGKTVATVKASAESTALSLSNVPAGLYIVKTDLGARKFVKK